MPDASVHMRSELVKLSQRSQSISRRSYWTPTRFELLIFAVLVVAWLGGMTAVILHEQTGWLLSIVYIFLALVGMAVSWLILWPILRFLLRQ